MQVRHIILSYVVMLVACATASLDVDSTIHNGPTGTSEDFYELFKNLLDTIPKIVNCSDDIKADINKLSTTLLTETYQLGLQNEDLHLNITQLIAKNGYPVEQHEMTTSDGYVLNIFRIPGNGSVVFLMHGMMCSSNDWVSTGKERALAYILAKAGYDVWLGNARGTMHSRKNIYMSPESSEFWDFSWDEIGRIDVPTMIDYILGYTNQSTLQYIGHSQGTTSFFVMCSKKPEYNKKISKMIALSAVAWMGHIKGPILKIIELLLPVITSMTATIGHFELFPRNIVNLAHIACSTPETAALICNNVAFLFCGFDYLQLNSSYLPMFYSHGIAASTSKTAIHYLQLSKSKQFRQYDYGVSGNMKRYGSQTPPSYDVERITAPIVIFYADNDWLSNIEDVLILTDKLPNLIELYRVPFSLFNHLDFLLANGVKTLVYDKLMTFLND